jgi:integrase
MRSVYRTPGLPRDSRHPTDARTRRDFSRRASLGDGPACLERAGRCQPANGRLAHAVGAGQIGLCSAFCKPLDCLLPLVRGQLERAPKTYTTRLRSFAAVVGAGTDLLLLTGGRRGEIIRLQWQHIDFEQQCLRLPDSKTGAKVVYLNAPC